MKKNKRILTPEILVFIVVILGIFSLFYSVLIGYENMTWFHENAHKQIFESYGINSTIKMSLFGLKGGLTTPTNWTKYNENCNDDCQNLNNLNEIVGYSVMSATMMISIILLTLGIAILLIMLIKMNGR
jgi:hypothetical protein